ncbi:hypothetical protein AAG570_001044 [Ranatra chinensis]|uniref:Uncharacterized protein n=1 Tax=Ranatra chinensis TaxID=642074 RepID=A0ABD0YAP7_9HEMI
MGMLKRRTEEGPTKLMDISLAHKNKLKNEMERLKKAGESLRGSYDKWLWDKTTALEKLHFITGHGILCPELRDEIYCQICKQLTENPNIMSQNSGWYLMYLCCGCFAPSLKFTPVLFNFIESHKGRLQENCRTILQRTLQNGTRNQPPSQFELKAALKGLPLVVEVHLPARDPVWVEIDAATTAHEICSQIFKHINLEDNFGFSLFISIFGSVRRLLFQKNI